MGFGLGLPVGGRHALYTFSNPDEDKLTAQIADQNDLPFAGATKCAIRTKSLVVVRIDALPAEDIAQMIGKRPLDEPVFAIDVSDHVAPVCPAY
jgi:hypothetical protein